MKSDTSQLTLLGHKTVYKQDYAPEVLETFINKHPERLLGTIQLPGVYQSVPDYRTTRFRYHTNRLYSRRTHGRKQESKTLFIQFP